MIYRVLAGLFGASGVGVFLCLIVFYLRSPTVESGLMVEDPNRVLKDLLAQRDYDIEFHIYNPSGRTVRIAGWGLA